MGGVLVLAVAVVPVTTKRVMFITKRVMVMVIMGMVVATATAVSELGCGYAGVLVPD